MSTDIKSQLINARSQVARKQELSQRKVELREAISQESYRRETFEIQLDMISRDLQKLERFGLRSVLTGLLGDKAARIASGQQSQTEVQRELEDCRDTLDKLQVELTAVVPELEALGDCEQRYETLFDEAETALLESEAEPVTRLRALHEQRDQFEDAMRHVDCAAEAIDSVMTSLNTAKISSRRVSQRKLSGQGVVGGVFNTVMNQALKPARGGMESTLEHLLETLEAVRADLTLDPTPEDRELDAEIQAFGERFTGGVILSADCDALLACETETANLQRGLQGRRRDLQQRVDELAVQRREVVERD